jgi:(1->4)-alpha-D-glucan 1-alpha-D-glucosylmutase
VVSQHTALDRLCAHFGIAASYCDAGGREQRVPDATRRALLRALGVSAGDPETECRSLDAVLERDWRRILPPVAVVSEDTANFELPLTLPESEPARSLRWTLTQENGDTRDGALRLSDPPVTDQRSVDGQTWTRRRIGLPLPHQPGYHHLQLAEEAGEPVLASTTIILTPGRCYVPETLSGDRRSWGLSAQLYAVRSARNWGIGDFTDLTRLIELTAESGAGALALDPLHARFPYQPERCDPYAPSSRLFLDILHIDVEAIPELADSPQVQAEIAREDFQALLRAVRSDPLVDYAAVAKAKLTVLARLYRHFRERHLEPGTRRGQDFEAFRKHRGEALRRFALFEALSAHFSEDAGTPLPCGDWPEPYRRLESEEVARFAAEHTERVALFAWLQWQAQQQLQAVGWRSLALRLGIGLCGSLAVGAMADGAEVWAQPGLYVPGARVGAPGDDSYAEGAQRGVVPWHPTALREAGYAPFVAALRANMRDMGGLRIDRLSALLRPFLIPAEMDPPTGTYLEYPAADLLGVLALESVRNRCLVIGEGPDKAPGAASAALTPPGALPFRALYFARNQDGGFLAPAEFEPQSTVSAAAYDLPPLAGFWQGTDLEQRRTLGRFAQDRAYEEQLVRRSNDRARLFLALHHEGLLEEARGPDPVAVPELTPEHIRAIYVYLARTPSRVLLIQTADLLGQTNQVTLPGSGGSYPDWRRRQPLELENWAEQPQIQAVLAAVREERGVSERTAPAPEGRAGAGPGRAAIPRATYRLQLHAGFGFAAAADLVPYLAELGISHCYFSPYLKARPGSTHGYDVIAHDRLNPELGTEQDYQRLCDALATHEMGQILDMVPNHVGVMGADNGWWLDVLENGPGSPYADYFDIDWEPLRQELRGKVLVPVLGDHYGNVLDSGALELVFSGGAFRVDYYEHRLPIDPREYPRILAPRLAGLQERLGPESADLATFESLITAFGNLPARWRLEEDALIERRRDKELHKQRLAELCTENADLDWYVQECLRDFNGAEDYPADAGRLHALLEAQPYRLAHWRVAADEINYRRFFDINDLAALRMENPEAFDATHRLVLDLIAEGKLAGLRIDHPDGLYDPAEYFRWIQQRVEARQQGSSRRDEGNGRPLYLIVEKILVGDEQLRSNWPVHGTTGYEFAALADALLVDPQGGDPLSRCYRDFAGEAQPFSEEICAAKRLVMRNMLSSELHVLANELARIAESDPHTRDYTSDALRETLAEVVACFPVYRTYITPEDQSSGDRNQVLKAVSEARRRSQAADLSVFGFVRDVLLTDVAEGKPEAYRQRVLRLAMKFQQYTGPVTAKGVEDTAFYRYHRLVSLNEVGGDPERFGVSIEAFHRANARRRMAWPNAMLAGSTHDSKRSEDLRARLHVLSEIPDEWQEHVGRWARLNRRFRRDQDEGTLPDANTEYLLYQTLLGAWPLEELDAEALDGFRARIGGYMEKAVKEAKVNTAWTNPDAEYESALEGFIASILDRERNAAFFDDFLPFQRRVARLGLFNSLSQTLLRLTAPGVPDIYQGCELWSFSLVDPDNRRPVDFGRRQSLQESLRRPRGADPDLLGVLLEGLPDGRAKLHLIRRALELRRADPELFERGDYTPLRVEGPHAGRLCAYARTHAGRSVIALAPRLLAGLTRAEDSVQDPFADSGWSSTFVEIPAPVLEDGLAGITVQANPGRDRHILPIGELLRRFPVGLLTGRGPSDA